MHFLTKVLPFFWFKILQLPSSLSSFSSFFIVLLCLVSIMVVQSQWVYDHLTSVNTTTLFNEIPMIDLSDPEAKTLLVNACENLGFFKLINHGVPNDFITSLENEALKFFKLSQSEKDRAGPPNPFGYGNKRIGPNGDVGWIEYLLFNTDHRHHHMSQESIFILNENPEIFRSAVEKYISAMKGMALKILELIAEGLGVEKDELSNMLRDERSDCCFRINHYPPYPELEATTLNGRNLIGFGEHTDPQIISVLRSNNTTGLQICLRDGSWFSVPPDNSSFFINVGDSLQVMTNGRFRSVKHKVLVDPIKSRFSMVYFGGPPLSEKIAPLPSLLREGEQSLYKEFTWEDYKKTAYKLRLADYRLGFFEKKLHHLT